MVLHLGISVSLANILLFLFTEVFIVLMTFHTTRLAARYLLNRQLSHGNKVPLTTTAYSIVDSLPYNSDLQPVSGPIKLGLTLCRLTVIAISVYVGATLEGEVRHDTKPLNISFSTGMAPVPGGLLTNNGGPDMSATAKLSCLRLINDHGGILYKGYMAVAGSQIFCEDGLATFEEKILLQAEFREGSASDVTGLSMKGMNILRAKTQPDVTVSDTSIVYSPPTEDGTSSGDSCKIVLHEEKDGGQDCVFGIRRMAGRGFLTPIDLNITTTCKLEVLDFSRMLSSKPTFLPPGVSFLLQVLDSMVISRETTEKGPDRRTDSVSAVIGVDGLATAIVVAIVATALGISLWVALRVGNIQSDFTSVKGVAELWGEEKFGTGTISSDDSGLFVALEGEDKTPYLGSIDGVSKADRKSVEFELHEDLSLTMSESGGSGAGVDTTKHDIMFYSQSRQSPDSDGEV